MTHYVLLNLIIYLIENTLVIILALQFGKKLGYGRSFRPILAMALFSIWNTIPVAWSFVSNGENIDGVIITILLIFVTLLAVKSIQISPVQIYGQSLEKVIDAISWMILALLIVQIIEPSYQFILVDPPLGFPTFSMAFTLFFVTWAITVVSYITISELKEEYKLEYLQDDTAHKGFILGASMILLGVVIQLSQVVLNSLTSLEFSSLIFYLSAKHILNFGVIILFVATLSDPLALLPTTRSINYQLYMGRVPTALISFETAGPVPMYNEPLLFIDGDEFVQKDFISHLGVIGMTTLGMGVSYIEGSAIIPVPNHEDRTAIFLSSFVRDSNQQDPRLHGMNYLVQIIILPQDLDWITDYREELAAVFQKKAAQIEDLKQDFDADIFIQSFRKNLLEITLKF